MRKYLKLSVLVDNPKSWFHQYLERLLTVLRRYDPKVSFVRSCAGITKGDILFILSCDRVLSREMLSINAHNIVVHASDLPKGRGWSPWTWQVESGKNDIPVMLFEAGEGCDTGPYYIKSTIRLDGTELIEGIRAKIADKVIEMVTKYLEQYPMQPIPQRGRPTYFKRRNKENFRIDINKPIRNYFNKMRVADNEQYPLFFERGGKEYILKIYDSCTDERPGTDAPTSPCRDVVIRYENSRIELQPLGWDTKFFGIRSYLVNNDKTNIVSDNLSLRRYVESRLPGASFITAKIPQHVPQYYINFLSGIGFKFILTGVILRDRGKVEKDLMSAKGGGLAIVKMDKPRELPYHKLGGVFSLTRFHRDDHIGPGMVDLLWRSYLEHFLPVKRNHQFLAMVKEDVVGVLLLREIRDKERRISEITYIAVMQKHQGKSIGSMLMSAAVKWSRARGNATIVGTQACNNGSLNFYFRNGFEIIDTYTVFHRWSRDGVCN